MENVSVLQCLMISYDQTISPPLDSGGFVRVLRAAGKRSGDQMGGPHDEVGLAAPIVLIAQPAVN